jgi:broad specificity phosphatase PhoE
MTRVLLVRHGQASAGASDYDNLSVLGRAQSKQLGRWLAERKHALPTHVFIGPRKRHKQTWEELEAGYRMCNPEVAFPEVSVLEDLDEHHGLQFLTLAMAELVKREDGLGETARRVISTSGEGAKKAYIELILHALPLWGRGEIDHPDVESWSQFLARASRLEPRFRALKESHENPHAWAISSGGLISAVAAHALGADSDTTFEMMWSMRNTALTELGAKRSRAASRAASAPNLSLFSFNGVPHLEHEDITFV